MTAKTLRYLIRTLAFTCVLPSMLIGSCLFSVSGASAEDNVVFEGHDPLWETTTTIVERDGAYFMDGSEMEELRHVSMPRDGLSLAMKDRIEEPSMYWHISPGKIDLYINCEFGTCELKRSIMGTCCSDP